MQVRVADCVIDRDRRQVFRAGKPLTLSPKAYQLLMLLVEARPKALSKQELHEALWPDTFVVEANLSNLVGEIRTALGDSPRQPRIIRTLHGFGYACAADVAPVGWMPVCWLQAERDEYPLRTGENIIGRAEDAQVRFGGGGVSRRHARIVVSGDGVLIEDLGSKNGTAVRGQRLTGPRPLSDGDDVAIGSVRVVFRVASPGGATTDTI